MQAADISVAVIEQSERSAKLIDPLLATEMDVVVDPNNPYERDIVIVDTPDRKMAYEVLKKPIHDAQLVFRMRGDPFFGIDEWIDSRVKEWLAKHVVMPNVDGCITITPYHADLFQEKTGVTASVADLPISPEKWPDVTHTDHELRIVSLTNCVYKPKIQPLIDAAPTVESVLQDTGGYWHICGDGNYEDYLADELEQYDHISFEGYVDAEKELGQANLMVHLSNLDGWPNAILEGMASRLPVITNDHHAFTDKNRPNEVVCCHDELIERLHHFQNPETRQAKGDQGHEYARTEHAAEVIGQDYVAYFKRLLSRSTFKQMHGMEHPDPHIHDS
jgi:glycosyltransferase involved in cell wall biosynthesis